MEPATFWKNVKSLIKSNNVTQEWVCKHCGIPLGTMKNGIANNRYPSLDNAYKIAEALNTSIEFLLTGKDSVKADNSESIRLLQKVIENLS